MRFYTYLWLRQDGTPYYVGKGHGRRGFVTKGHGIHRPQSDARILVQYWFDEQEAFEMEKWYIRLFGRKDLDTGILRNLTDGGEGGAGYRHTEEWKRANGERMKAAGTRPPNLKGKKKSAAWLEKRLGAPGNTTGKRFSDEVHNRMKEAQQKRRANEGTVPQEFRDKMSKLMQGNRNACKVKG